MKKFILLFLLTNSYYLAYNQVIKGVIIDRQTKSAISFAAVYFNGTYVGTTSDENGNFRLVITKQASKPLTISAVGYYSYTLSDFSAGEPIIISLEPKVYEIMEVSVSTRSLSRERKANLKFFDNLTYLNLNF